MMMPDLLYALGRNTKNSKWLGDILRATCGQTVKLDEAQAAVVAVCKESLSELEERRKGFRERKAAQRAREKGAK